MAIVREKIYTLKQLPKEKDITLIKQKIVELENTILILKKHMERF